MWMKVGKNKVNHNEYDKQEFHQNDKEGIGQIMDTYALHNFLEWTDLGF